MNNEVKTAPAPAWAVIAAFATVYLIWGSTYLGIRYAIETIPPFLMAGSRNMAAGVLMMLIAFARGESRPSLVEWRNAVIAGGLMLTLGNGGVTWAEKFLPSSETALLVALTPLWMVLFDWLRPEGTRPGWLVMAGLAVGFVGVSLLARSHGSEGQATYGWAAIVVLISSVGWALGTIFNRAARKPASPLLAGGMQMLAGGALLLALGERAGEWNQLSFAALTPRSVSAWLFLMVAGSMIAYSVYVWLLHASTPARVSTTAYVNPLIAVLLGCTLGREPFSHDVLVAGGLIIGAVVLVLRGGAKKATAEKVATVCEEIA